MTSAGTKQLRAQSRSCWWVCKWAVSGMESSLKKTPFRYVTSRKTSSLLGRLQQTHSITCPLMSHRSMCWHPDVAPSCIKHHLFKDLGYSAPSALAVMQIFVQDLSVLWRRCLPLEGGIKEPWVWLEQIPPLLFSGALMPQRVSSAVQSTHVAFACFGAH